MTMIGAMNIEPLVDIDECQMLIINPGKKRGDAVKTEVARVALQSVIAGPFTHLRLTRRCGFKVIGVLEKGRLLLVDETVAARWF